MVPPDSDRVPPAPPYSGFGLGSRAFRIRGCHPLRPAFPGRFRYARSFLRRPSYNPARALTRTVWAGPLSLAATRGVTIVFLSSAYLDVSVRRVGLPLRDAVPSARRVAPFGYPRIIACSQLPAAFRSLLRPSSPPGAKASPVCPDLLVRHHRPRLRRSRVSSLSCVSSLFVICLLALSAPARPHGPPRLLASFFPSCQSAPGPRPLYLWRIRDSNP